MNPTATLEQKPWNRGEPVDAARRPGGSANTRRTEVEATPR